MCGFDPLLRHQETFYNPAQMSFDQRRAPALCMCCHKPLTHIEQRVTPPPTESDPTPEAVTQESWECTDEVCIAYRKRYAMIPTPPRTK